MKQITIQENDAGQRIDKYLKKLLVRAPANLIYKMFRKKDVKINGKAVNEKYILTKGDILSLFLYEDKFIELTEEKEIHDIEITFDVLYEDAQILVVNKPVGLLVHEDNNERINTLSNQVLKYLHQKGEYNLHREQSFIPGPAHRLDRNTSGIVIFGKTLAALQTLHEMIKRHDCIEKRYLTIVKGKVAKAEDLQGYIKKLDDKAKVIFVKKNSEGALFMHTKVFPRKCGEKYSLVEVQILTGRMHQIRLHLASIQHPIIGDAKYGDFQSNRELKQKFHLQHQLLHAYKIRFTKTFNTLAYLEGKEIISLLPKQFKQIENKLVKL